MSHDRGCPCGKEFRDEYVQCKEESCSRRTRALDGARTLYVEKGVGSKATPLIESTDAIVEHYRMINDINPDMTTHDLRTFKRYWDAVKSGRKTFEVRKNDRAFQTGDILRLLCTNEEIGYGFAYLNDKGHKTSFEKEAAVIVAQVSYILQGGQFGIEPSYCVLGLKLL